jgi:tol-pal system protein YbgF
MKFRRTIAPELSRAAPAALFALAALVAGLAAPGCGRSAEERQLDAMREEIDNVRQSRDRSDHAANSPNTSDSAMVVPQAYAPGTPAHQPPSVVQLGTDGQAYDEDDPEGDPQDTTPRPSIRVSGGVVEKRGGRRTEVTEHTVPDDGAGASSASSRVNPVDPEAKRAYDAAYALVTAHRYEQALDALAAFLLKWPDHPYANNAMFWRGECYFARGDYQRASEQFDGVLKRYPAGSKAPDALLKLGISQQKLGNTTKAKECFDRLAQQYPGTEAARRIPAQRASTAAPVGPAPEDR